MRANENTFMERIWGYLEELEDSNALERLALSMQDLQDYFGLDPVMAETAIIELVATDSFVYSKEKQGKFDDGMMKLKYSPPESWEKVPATTYFPPEVFSPRWRPDLPGLSVSDRTWQWFHPCQMQLHP